MSILLSSYYPNQDTVYLAGTDPFLQTLTIDVPVHYNDSLLFTNTDNLFHQCTIDAPIYLDTRNVVSMRHMFSDATINVMPDLDTRRVRDMHSMFKGATFAGAAHARFDTANVLTATDAFASVTWSHMSHICDPYLNALSFGPVLRASLGMLDADVKECVAVWKLRNAYNRYCATIDANNVPVDADECVFVDGGHVFSCSEIKDHYENATYTHVEVWTSRCNPPSSPSPPRSPPSFPLPPSFPSPPSSPATYPTVSTCSAADCEALVTGGKAFDVVSESLSDYCGCIEYELSVIFYANNDACAMSTDTCINVEDSDFRHCHCNRATA